MDRRALDEFIVVGPGGGRGGELAPIAAFITPAMHGVGSVMWCWGTQAGGGGCIAVLVFFFVSPPLALFFLVTATHVVACVGAVFDVALVVVAPNPGHDGRGGGERAVSNAT